MSPEQDIPLWLALGVSILALLGAFLTLLGTIGLVRLQSFYQRIHAPTLGTSYGTASIVIASILFFSYVETRPVLHEVLIGIFITATTPVTLMLLGRAALYRDRAEGKDPVLPADEQADAVFPITSSRPHRR